MNLKFSRKLIIPFQFVLIFIFQSNAINSFCQKKLQTPYEKSGETATANYFEGIQYFKELSNSYPSLRINELGITDAGYPLHIVTYNNPTKKFTGPKITVLIINAIHPGEPDGVDASMKLMRDIAENKILSDYNESFILHIVPFYNIGGALNRSPYSRANQNGPIEYGFRGNAKNYDLNRDFIKSDTKNSKTFFEIFHSINPDIFIDTHTSNGADYQYTITCLETHPVQLGGALGTFLSDEFSPALFRNMEEKNHEMCPFVNVYNQTPELGYSQFLDHPHYSTGYTTLFNTLGFMAETHMLKPFKQRVESTYAFLSTVIEEGSKQRETILALKQKDEQYWQNVAEYNLQWEVDKSEFDSILFKGYKSQMIPSKVTGQERLKYNRNEPYTKQIPYYNKLKSNKTVSIPDAYIVPKSWYDVIEILSLNNLKIDTIHSDTTINVESYKIRDFETYKNPYEGHYMHYNTMVSMESKTLKFNKGDFIVFSKQKGIRYLLETLEPEARDSFFNWNFFDTILMRKEGFSSYVFEDMAEELLKENKWLRDSLELKKSGDPGFASNSREQLNYIYQLSPYFEPGYRQYPVYRIIN